MKLSRPLAIVATTLLATSLVSFTAAPAAARTLASHADAERVAAPDPVGTYDWSLDAGSSSFSGTLAVAKTNDTTFTATVTHANTGEVVKAKVVKLTGEHLLVISDTAYGDLAMDIKLADAGIEAMWKVGDGSYGGPLKIAKRKS